MTDLVVQSFTEAEIIRSIDDFAEATTPRILKRAKDIRRDKIFAVHSFFSIVGKNPDQIVVADVSRWHDWMLERGKTVRKRKKDGTFENKTAGLQAATVYTRIAHLSSYFEWLRKIPEFAYFIKTNPVRPAMPKPPKKYNSPQSKALTDEEFSKLWTYLETLAEDDKNLAAARDYAIFRFFAATGMRREEIIGLRAGDLKITEQGILIRALVKGGDYQWRIIADDDVRIALERYLTLTKRKSSIGDSQRALWIRFDRGAKAAAYKIREANSQNGEQSILPEPRLSSHGYERQIKKYAREAGIGHFHIHQLRHTFARIVSEETGSLIETQDALGHANLETTREYVRRIEYKKDKFSRVMKNRGKKSAEKMEESVAK